MRARAALEALVRGRFLLDWSNYAAQHGLVDAAKDHDDEPAPIAPPVRTKDTQAPSA
jgi:hypothetical protein